MSFSSESGISIAKPSRMSFQAKIIVETTLAKARSEINEIRQSKEHESVLANKARSKLVSLKNDTGIERTELETLAKEEAFAIVKGQQSEQNKQTYLSWLSKEFTIDSYETLKDKVATENRAKLSTEIAPASSSSSSSSGNARPGRVGALSHPIVHDKFVLNPELLFLIGGDVE